ncbi:unnamed protein product (macronuclear) [Paramecium tetraurelia]|uniref:Uncharacterized protein n=1 Tax=Paramecium tetraurelia TaxID=5888 RepID=A0D5Q1_PARTE|nr:uncharacterized protein GSPATT00013798001 [Paramecium tetraurelia]CAK78368.1 unnamed protein product [Paramecium tetraurelia]|eukprot:XP_001445765.1 hypothetical protein (macronuclear) [Paramecium tetraurelia strain d4-2]
MSEDSNSILTTIKYYKSILKFPSFPKQYSELDETQEQNDLFFCNSKQRKEESLKLLKEWAQDRMELFERNREIVEELANSCDYKIRLSVDFLQIAYKFFNEKYFHEQQYAQFLITKPQPALKQNPLNQSLYSTVGTSVSTFEEHNLKRLEKIANFAHSIQTDILKAKSFSELSDMDRKLDVLLSSIITQKKLLQNYITSAGQKLNLIIQQFPQHQVPQRQRKPIFDDQQQQNKTDKQNTQAQGNEVVGTECLQNPAEKGLNKSIKEQERQIREQQLKDEQSLSNGSEFQQEELQEQQEQKQEQQDEAKCEIIQNKEEQPQQLQNQEQFNDSQEQSVQQQQQEKQAQHFVETLNSAEMYKQQQQLKERQTFDQNKLKSKNYQSQGQPNIQQQIKNEDDGKKQQNQQVDVYRLIVSFVATQQYANKLLNQLVEKVISYWKQVIAIEQTRAQWAKDSCQIYKNGIAEVHNLQVELPELKIDVEDHYKLKKLLPKEMSQFEDGNEEDFLQTLVIKELGCQAARLLLIKEFKVNVIDKTNEIQAILVLTIDKYVGCWFKHDETVEVKAIDNPVLHYPINGMAIQKVNELVLDIMPSRHLLFLNIANDRQKSRIKFQTADDMEEFCTISQAKV